MESISIITAKLKNLTWDKMDVFILEYEKDERAGVQKLVEKAKKQKEAYLAECNRIEGMKQFEKQYSNLSYICGIDEVGRGPLAGPVVAAAVVLPKDCDILYLNDSKQLSAKKREELYDEIMKKAISVGIGIQDESVIDSVNILNANYIAMREAISKLTVEPEVLLNDAVTIPEVDILQVPIIKGDTKSISIAAASIIAKVTRDNIMVEYDEVYKGYGFAKNKGYGSKEHIEAIKELGPCPIHRRTFIKNFIDDSK
ncbi:MAG: ribonuclease HII [Lachnospiraceae bacterium]|nr:ribonuclease HII [Lachnospiraceae bacterium]